jgi:hypothetical protein
VATDPPPAPFSQESTLFASINEGYIDEFVEIYVPVEWQTPADKSRIHRECREPIKELIEKMCTISGKGGAGRMPSTRFT